MNFSPAYHLRTNKAVERLLFIELLRRLDRELPKHVEDYTYVGLGGPYLEDFNTIYAAFGNQRMISLELKEHVLSRQKLNQPYSRLKLTLSSTREFVDEFQSQRDPLIVWFDYEQADWKNQLIECCDLLPKLPSMSIFKVTLPGSTKWLGSDLDNVARAEKLSEIFADYGPFTATDISPTNIYNILYGICRRAIAEGAPDTRQRSVRSLASYSYNDGTPILTVTMIIGPIDTIEAVIQSLSTWVFADVNWQGPKEIAVPPLSLREKLAVDCLLPASGRTVINKLKLRFSEDYRESIAAMDNYVRLYRHVPHFVRITL